MISEQTRRALLAFRKDRQWEQFHTPKNLAVAISVEAGELLEQFQWTLDQEFAPDSATLDRIRREMADVAILLTYLATDLNVDLDAAVQEKLAINAKRYPVETSRGSAKKSEVELGTVRSGPPPRRSVASESTASEPPSAGLKRRRGSSTPPPILAQLPEGLRQVLEVVHLVRTTRRDRVEAITEVARRHRVSRETVADKCCRGLGVNTIAFEMWLGEPNLGGLERALRQKYREYSRPILSVLQPLRR